VQLGERKNGLIKNNAPRYVYTTGRHIKTFVTLVVHTVPQEVALLGSESEFVVVLQS
jgi:hypothetical protein